jgi:hypothetical protein
MIQWSRREDWQRRTYPENSMLNMAIPEAGMDSLRASWFEYPKEVTSRPPKL